MHDDMMFRAKEGETMIFDIDNEEPKKLIKLEDE
jgi:hypothetical protein